MSNYKITDSVFSDTDLTTPIAVGSTEIEYLFDDYDYRKFRQKYVVIQNRFERAILGSTNTQFTSAILTHETNPTPMDGGLCQFTREYVEVPTRPTREMTIMSVTYPSLHYPTKYVVERSGDDINYREVIANLIRKPFTTTTSALIEYNYYVVPPQLMNAETILVEEYIDFPTTPKDPIAGSGTIFGLNQRTVDYIDNTTTPHVYNYIGGIVNNDDDDFTFGFAQYPHSYSFRIEDTQVEKWIGNIYRTRDVFVKPR